MNARVSLALSATPRYPEGAKWSPWETMPKTNAEKACNERSLNQMVKKGVKARIKLLQGLPKAVNPIPRGRDNTDDLLDAVEAVHAKNSHLRAPVGTASKSARKGAFNPTDNAAFNGNQIQT